MIFLNSFAIQISLFIYFITKILRQLSAYTTKNISLNLIIHKTAVPQTTFPQLETIHPCNQSQSNSHIIARRANWCPVNRPSHCARTAWPKLDRSCSPRGWIERGWRSVKRNWPDRHDWSIPDKRSKGFNRAEICPLILHNFQGEPYCLRSGREAGLATGLITSSIRGTRMHHEVRIVFAIRVIIDQAENGVTNGILDRFTTECLLP